MFFENLIVLARINKDKDLFLSEISHYGFASVRNDKLFAVSYQLPYASVIWVISGGQLKRMGRATVPKPRETYICERFAPVVIS